MTLAARPLRILIAPVFLGLAIASAASPLARMASVPRAWANLPFVDPAPFVTKADRAAALQPARADSAGQATFAKGILRRQPIQPAAMRMLALSARNPAEARERMALAQRLTRRDLVTTFWRIESAAEAGDMAAVLAGYDIAMRTGFDSWSLLFDKLGAGLSEPSIRAGLEPYLAARAAWRDPFLDYLLLRPDSHIDLAALFRESRSLSGDTTLAARRASLSRMLIEARKYQAARTLTATKDRVLLTSPALSARSLAADAGGLGWLLADGADGSAMQTADASGRPALALAARPDRAPVLARKILFLPSGRYRIALRSEAGSAIGPLAVATACAGPQTMREIARSAPAPAGATGATLDFPVPPGCPVQQIDMRLFGATGQADTVSTVARIELSGPAR